MNLVMLYDYFLVVYSKNISLHFAESHLLKTKMPTVVKSGHSLEVKVKSIVLANSIVADETLYPAFHYAGHTQQKPSYNQVCRHNHETYLSY